jgi:hypothetical protein
VPSLGSMGLPSSIEHIRSGKLDAPVSAMFCRFSFSTLLKLNPLIQNPPAVESMR